MKNSYEQTQYVGYAAFAIGAVLIMYNLAFSGTSQLWGMAGVGCIIFAIFRLIKRNSFLKEQEIIENKDSSQADPEITEHLDSDTKNLDHEDRR